MVFTTSLYISLIICFAGIFYKFGTWFRLRIGPEVQQMQAHQRFLAALKELRHLLFSRHMFTIIRFFFSDIVLQLNILKKSRLRWCMHVLIFYSFLVLIVMHAADELITARLFPEYAATLNPYLFLRNLTGFLALTGILIAFSRRLLIKKLRHITAISDLLFLFLLTLVLVSGIALEAAQIVSEPMFDEMVADYFDSDDTEGVQALQAYWARQYGVVFESPTAPPEPAILAEGRDLNAGSCIICHSLPSAAFMSFNLAKAIAPAAVEMNRNRIDIGLWYLHFLASFLCLALLPFSKIFHIITTPIGLLLRPNATAKPVSPLTRANHRAFAFDACTHCGTCSLHCSVAPIYKVLPNPTILPSEKLIALRKMVTCNHYPETSTNVLSEGSFICTECMRCTTLCPSGIQLQDLWITIKQDLQQRGFPEQHLRMQEKTTAQWAEKSAQFRQQESPSPQNNYHPILLSDQSETFSACIQCTTCTTVCPVVAIVDDPADELDLTPQQIMNLLRLKKKDLALGSRMVWKCTTCYMCQEHCPQGVKVADVLYELRNIAYERFKRALPIDRQSYSGQHDIPESNQTDSNKKTTQK